MTIDPASGTHEDDDAPIEPGPGLRWGGDGALARARAPRWGSDEAALADVEVTPAGVRIPPPAPPAPVARCVPTLDGIAFASVLRRLTAFLGDRLLKAVIFVTVLTIAGVEVPTSPWQAPEMIVASALLNAGYDFIFGIAGVTPAAYLLRIRIAALDGDVPGVRRSLVRAAAAALNEAFLFAGSIWILFDPRRQALHDKVAGTIVVNRTPPGAPRQP